MHEWSLLMWKLESHTKQDPKLGDYIYAVVAVIGGGVEP